MKFGLLWHSFSSGNLGVGALSLSNMLLIEEVARKLDITPEFLLIGSSGPCDYPPIGSSYKYEFIEFSEKSLLNNSRKLFSAIGSCDAIFDIGEGDSFSDIYGGKRLIKLLVSKCMALANGVPLVLSPQTIGPFKSSLGRNVSAWVMRRSAKVFARDHQSFEVLEQMNISSRYEAVDVAFHLPFDIQSELRDHSRLAVGLSISALLYHGGYAGAANQFSLTVDYKSLTNRLIEHLLDCNYEVHLISHVIPLDFPEEDDYALALHLKESYPELKLAPRFNGPIEAKSYIAALDFFVGARMHATIAAFSASVPVVPLAYSRKFSGLYESLNYSRVIDLKSESNESALNKILASLASRKQLKAEVTDSGDIIRHRLAKYSSDLEDFIVSLAERRKSVREDR
nr:polysaccharide pyruvyl transferase family protein [Pseudomonas oleovorans]